MTFLRALSLFLALAAPVGAETLSALARLDAGRSSFQPGSEGLTLALACDFRIASERAFFQYPEVQIGIPTIAGAVRAPRRNRMPGSPTASRAEFPQASTAPVEAEGGALHRGARG